MGMTGSGGSILTVPVFVYALGITPLLATSYSLFIVGITGLFGAVYQFRHGRLDSRTALLFSLPSLVGVFVVRKYVIHDLPDMIWQSQNYFLTKDDLIMLAFAIMMVAAAVSLIRDARRPPPVPGLPPKPATRYSLIMAEGLFIGAVTGFLGAGGGFLIVPALVLFTGLTMEKAVGTSLAIIAAKSLVGFAGDLSVLPEMDWSFLLLFTTLSALGVALGSRLCRMISGKRLQLYFGVFLFFFGLAVLIWEILT